MKKLLLGIIATAAGLVVTSNVSALELSNVEVVSAGGDSFKSGTYDLRNENLNDITVIYNEADLKMVEPNPDIGRQDKAAWVGVKVSAPTDATLDKLKTTTFANGNETGIKNSGKSFWTLQDTEKALQDSAPANEHYIYVYAGITVDNLTAAAKKNTMINHKWWFDWDSDGVYDQTLTILVDPSRITLEDSGDTDTILWSEDNYNELKPEDTNTNQQTPAPKEENKLDDVPKTGNAVPMTYIGMILLGMGVAAYTVKKAYAKN